MALSTLIIRRLPAESWLAGRRVRLQMDLELVAADARALHSNQPRDALDGDAIARGVKDLLSRLRAEVLEHLLCELARELLHRHPLREVMLEATQAPSVEHAYDLSVRVRLDRQALRQLDAEADRYDD